MRTPLLDRGRFALALALVLAAGCRSATEQPASGSLLLDVHLASGAPMPDELRLSAYDDRGSVWQSARFPDSGALVPRSTSELGTILLQPGATSGALRIDLRGLVGGALVDEATLTIPAAAISGGTFDVTLSASLPPDGDGDGVPDPVDDCPSVADPAQTGCPADAGRDAAATDHHDAGRDVAPPHDAGHDSAIRHDAGHDIAPPHDAGHDTVIRHDAATVHDAGHDTATVHDAGRDVPPGKGNGVTCTGANECASGYCKDGVCCNNACNQPCNSCAPSGMCTSIKSGTDDPECAAPMSCNSKGKCVAGGG